MKVFYSVMTVAAKTRFHAVTKKNIRSKAKAFSVLLYKRSNLLYQRKAAGNFSFSCGFLLRIL